MRQVSFESSRERTETRARYAERLTITSAFHVYHKKLALFHEVFLIHGSVTWQSMPSSIYKKLCFYNKKMRDLATSQFPAIRQQRNARFLWFSSVAITCDFYHKQKVHDVCPILSKIVYFRKQKMHVL